MSDVMVLYLFWLTIFFVVAVVSLGIGGLLWFFILKFRRDHDEL